MGLSDKKQSNAQLKHKSNQNNDVLRHLKS